MQEQNFYKPNYALSFKATATTSQNALLSWHWPLVDKCRTTDCWKFLVVIQLQANTAHVVSFCLVYCTENISQIYHSTKIKWSVFYGPTMWNNLPSAMYDNSQSLTYRSLCCDYCYVRFLMLWDSSWANVHFLSPIKQKHMLLQVERKCETG